MILGPNKGVLFRWIVRRRRRTLPGDFVISSEIFIVDGAVKNGCIQGVEFAPGPFNPASGAHEMDYQEDEEEYNRHGDEEA